MKALETRFLKNACPPETLSNGRLRKSFNVEYYNLISPLPHLSLKVCLTAVLNVVLIYLHEL